MSFDPDYNRLRQSNSYYNEANNDSQSDYLAVLSQKEWVKEVMVVVNVRLGFEHIGENFHRAVIRCLKFSQFTGIVGGKPNKAFYFVGHSVNEEGENSLIFLDPHIVQPYVPDIHQNYVKNINVFHTKDARSISLKKLDPCLGFGFLVKNKTDFICFMDELKLLQSDEMENSIFSLFDKESDLDNGASKYSIRSIVSNQVSHSVV